MGDLLLIDEASLNGADIKGSIGESVTTTRRFSDVAFYHSVISEHPPCAGDICAIFDTGGTTHPIPTNQVGTFFRSTWG